MSDRALRAVEAALALAGVGIAGYLTYTHYAHTTIACPIAGGGCETVQESSYAELAGIPVALLGLLMYGAVLALVIWDDERARAICAVLTVAGLAFALYLLAVQLWVIDAICAWCVASDAVLTLLTLTALARLRSSGLRSSEPGGAPSARSDPGSR